MYAIYQSKTLILDFVDSGEKNRFFWLFTRDFGLVNAAAQSVRSTSSKLNPYLQQYNSIIIEFVRGKDIWRITNSIALDDSVVFSSISKRGQVVVARVCLLLKRLYVGEEANQKLFDDVLEGIKKISRAFDSKTIDGLETLLVLKILYHLGYWEEHKEHYPLHSSPFSQEMIDRALRKKKDLDVRIEQSLRESHL